MSKQFIKGNVYVFTKKKYMEDRCKCHSKAYVNFNSRIWVNMINGNKVTVDDNRNGTAGKLEMFVVPEWCKCIKNNNQIEKDKKLNLCSTCKFCFADCANGEEGIDFNFGTGIGFDNVYECKNYKNESEGM